MFPEKVGNIEQGVFIAEHNVMCYIACVYKLIQVVRYSSFLIFIKVYFLNIIDWYKGMSFLLNSTNHVSIVGIDEYLSNFQVKNDRLNKASITKQIDILYPQDLKESVKRNVANCVEIRKFLRLFCT